MNNSKVIGIDLDDTITNIQSEMRKYAIIFDMENNGHGIIDSSKYLVGEMYGWNRELLDKFFLTYRSKIVQEAKVRKHVIMNIKKWQKIGYKIIIITARNKKYYDRPFDETYHWLKKHHVPFDDLIVDASDKKEVCIKMNVNYFIDDMPGTCNLVSELPNVKVFIMENGNNYCDNKMVTRITSFDEINDFLVPENIYD